MKKHILIHGNNYYFKITFISNILKGKNYERIKCDNNNIPGVNSPFNIEVGDKEILYYQNVNILQNHRDFIALAGACCQNTSDNKLKTLIPRLIIEYSGCIEIPKEQSFLRRFHIINVDTMSYFEIMDFITNGLKDEPEEYYEQN